MSLFLGKISYLLTTPAGNLIYHLILAFSIAGALQGAIHHWRTSGFPQSRRAVAGLSILLAMQFTLFVFAGMAELGLFDPQLVLPPLDRAITLLSLVWITWLWVFPEPLKLADAATILLSFFVLPLFGLTILFYSQGARTDFNLSVFEIVWQGLCLAMVVLGLLVLFLRRPNGWGNGLAMMILAFLGHLSALIWPQAGDFQGFLRLTQLAMFPILLTLPQRFILPGDQQAHKFSRTDPKGKSPIRQERRRYSVEPKTFLSLISLAAETSPVKIYQDLTRSVSQAMLADLCFLFLLDSNKALSITSGYDLIREENLDGAPVDKANFPMLASAILRGRPLRLPASSTSYDLKALAKVLGLDNAGHLLSVPIISRDRGPIGSILILSPYSNRLWNTDDQHYLTNASPMFASVLERAEQMNALKTRSDLSRQELQIEQDVIPVVEQGSMEALMAVETQPEGLAVSNTQAEIINSQLIELDESQELVKQLQAENEKLRNSGVASPKSSEELENELRKALEEMAHMQNTLAGANARIMALEERPDAQISNEQVDVLASISQELRQPMSSIVGYTDLLLGESVGILGTLQRKFLERIKVSIERIGGLIDDLIQITNLDTGNMEFKPEAVDVNLIIDNAMTYTGTQIREKNITLRLDVPASLPQVQTDRDALQQVLIHLLQNAAVASKVEGTITLRVQARREENKDYLYLQVTDSGGGIPPEDISRVFMRRYRAEHSLIQGVGDTGVGLSIAKAVVEAQKGRIWVETQANVGSTISVLLPIDLEDQP